MWRSTMLVNRLLYGAGLSLSLLLLAWWWLADRQWHHVLDARRTALAAGAAVVEDGLRRLDGNAAWLESRAAVEQTLADVGRRLLLRCTLLDAHEQPLADSSRRLDTGNITAQRAEPAGPSLVGAEEVELWRGEQGGVAVHFVRVAARDSGWPVRTIQVSLPVQGHRAASAAADVAVLAALTLAGAGASGVAAWRLRNRIASLKGAVTNPADDPRRDWPTGSSVDEFAALARALNQYRQRQFERWDDSQRQADRLRTILNGMTEGVLAVDDRRYVWFANDACRALFQIPVTDNINRPLLEVVRNKDLDAAVSNAWGRDALYRAEISLTIPVRRRLSLLAQRITSTPGAGAVVVLQDITELRRLENLRRDFVANVSHELRTPLASIKAYTETLRLGAIDDPDHNLLFLERIAEQSERLNELITDLLHLARVEAGEEAFQFRRVAVVDVVDQVLRQHGPLAAANELQLTVAPPPTPLAVWADAQGMTTILENLVSNAVKYTPPRGSITVSWRLDGRLVRIDVADTGIGIAQEDQGRVFERFFRVDKARSREMGGTGLGLSIVKHLATAFRGRVGLTSQLQAGSTFSVWLPVVEDAHAADEARLPNRNDNGHTDDNGKERHG